MAKYEFTVTIGGSAVNLATQAFAGTAGVAYPNGWKAVYGTGTLLAAKLSFQIAAGSTGHVYIGNSSVSNAGANADYQLDPPSAGNAGTPFTIESHTDSNILDLAQFYVHGSHATDTVTISYEQE